MSSIVPTRRSVVRTAAWSLPAVAVASQAPAFASSTDGALQFLPGLTSVRTRDMGDYYDLCFSGASIRAGAAGIPAGQLRITLSYDPDPGVGSAWAFFEGTPSGWVADRLMLTFPLGSGRFEMVPAGERVVFTWGAAVAPGGTVVLEDGFWVGSEHPEQLGTYTVEISAPGEDVVRRTFRWEGPAPAARAQHAEGARASSTAGSKRLRAGGRG